MNAAPASDWKPLRTLFCLGVTPEFFAAPEEVRQRAFPIFVEAFDDLGGRFGVTVLGTMDDDRLLVGPSLEWPWTCYILADVPDVETVAAICNLVRETRVGEDRLWRYVRIEARVGRELFFGNR